MKSRSEFSALRDFLRGYFHEDCIEEYGSLAGAAQQFVEDADEEQRKIVAKEWGQFLRSFEPLSLEKINRVLNGMGSSCQFVSLDEVRSVGAIVTAGPLRG
jgi:hypothetical protein